MRSLIAVLLMLGNVGITIGLLLFPQSSIGWALMTVLLAILLIINTQGPLVAWLHQGTNKMVTILEFNPFNYLSSRQTNFYRALISMPKEVVKKVQKSYLIIFVFVGLIGPTTYFDIHGPQPLAEIVMVTIYLTLFVLLIFLEIKYIGPVTSGQYGKTEEEIYVHSKFHHFISRFTIYLFFGGLLINTVLVQTIPSAANSETLGLIEVIWFVIMVVFVLLWLISTKERPDNNN